MEAQFSFRKLIRIMSLFVHRRISFCEKGEGIFVYGSERKTCVAEEEERGKENFLLSSLLQRKTIPAPSTKR